MTYTHPAEHGARSSLVSPVRCDPAGLTGPTRWQTVNGDYRRTSHGLYVPGEVPLTIEQRILESAAILPAFGGVTGWAALRWLGGSWFHGHGADGSLRPVVLATGPCRVRKQPGIESTTAHLPQHEVVVHDGIRVTTALWSLVWELRHAGSDREAVAAADMAAYSDLVSAAELAAYVATRLPQTGIGRARFAVAHMVENSWSWQETYLRLVWILDVGLPPPSCNVPIFDRSGRHLATCDLLDEESGLALEYDGAVHAVSARRRVDARRERLLARHGVKMLTVVEGDLGRRDRLVERILRERALADFEAPSRRAWTTTPPAGWIPTLTVVERRALSEQQRAKYLGHRLEVAA